MDQVCHFNMRISATSSYATVTHPYNIGVIIMCKTDTSSLCETVTRWYVQYQHIIVHISGATSNVTLKHVIHRTTAMSNTDAWSEVFDTANETKTFPCMTQTPQVWHTFVIEVCDEKGEYRGWDSITGWVCDEMRQCDGLSVITLSHIIKLSQSYQAITSQQAVLILSYSISSILSSPHQAVPFCYTIASHSHQAVPIQSYHHALPIVLNYSITPSCPHPHTMTKSSCPHLITWKTIKLSPSY